MAGVLPSSFETVPVTRLIVTDVAQTGFFSSVDRIANDL